VTAPEAGIVPPVTDVPSSSRTRRRVLAALLVEGRQTTKVVIDPRRLRGEDHGFPASVIASYPEGIPLDLNPSWPLDLDLETDPDQLSISLSFSGRVCRCRVPWRAITMVAVGIGGVAWEHEDDGVDAAEPSSREPRRPHLRLVD
jgi:hypothetical protein